MSDQKPPVFLGHLAGFYAIWILAVAERTGLLDAVEGAPGSASELAARCGLDEQNTLETLRGLVAAQVAQYDGTAYSLTDDARAALDPSFPVDVRAIVGLNGSLSPLVGVVAEAIRTGSGVDNAQYAAVTGPGLACMGSINLPLYRQVLAEDWLGGTPALREALERGADVLDLGCASGETVRMVALAYPSARVQGWDPVAAQRTDLPPNASLHAGGLADVPSDSTDVLYSLDAFHHFGDASTSAEHLHRILRPGGTLLLAEDAGSGDVGTDTADPMSVIAFGSRLMYCMQDNLASGGTGLTSSDGTAWIDDALSRAGFTSITSRDTDSGTRLITALA